ncbi:MAG TPA: hypothetical protein VMG12_10695 [Polyangiaceae bacterium]|nr:hypothetical protein [Polyangiaceae bacterium]
MMRCTATAIVGALLLGLGCNTLLGIDESTCVGPCAGSLRAGSEDGSPPRDDDTPSARALAADAGGEAARSERSAADVTEDERAFDATVAARCAQDDGAPTFCIENRRVSCGAAGAAASVSVCASADHCERGSGAECAACSTEAVCEGAELWRCDPRRSEMVLADTCPSAALCDAANEACAVAACLPGQTRCQGVSFEACNASGTGFVRVEQCQSAITCDPEAGCQAPPCNAGEGRCAGGALQQCNTNGTGFDNVRNCGAPGLCNEDEGRCNECVPNTRRCVDSSTLGSCDARGLTETTRACRPALEACEDGECVLLGGLPL